MSKRIVAIVRRSLVDQTPVTVWDHEVPILEAIHGEGQVVTVPVDSLTEGEEAMIIKGTTQLVNPGSQLVRITKKGDKEFVEIASMREGQPKTETLEVQRIPLGLVLAEHRGLGDEFHGDESEEYSRLQTLYGMHTEIRTTFCEYVYGRFADGRFSAKVDQRMKVAA
jgi:hypothetical protein